MSAGFSATGLKQVAESVVVALAIAGDDLAFTEIVRRRQRLLRNFMRRLCGDSVLADDLAQHAFLQAWRSIRQLKSPAAFGGWFKKVAVNVWLQYARKQSSRLDDIDVEAEHDAYYREDHANTIDLDSTLRQLPEIMRLCVVLAYHDGMSHSEIAEATGLPLGTVKSHVARGTARLQVLLADYS